MNKTMSSTMIIFCVSSLLYSGITFLSVAKIQHDLSVDLLIDYGNGTAVWSTVFLSLGNNTAFCATQKGADSLAYTYFGDEIFVDAINGVRNNFTSGFWWAIFTWNISINTWSSLNVACNKHVLSDGGMVAWFYAVHPWPPTPPDDPPQTQVEVLVDYGNGTSEWNMASLSGAANAFKATLASVDSLDYSASGFGVFVDAINGVRNNFTSGFWWALFFWNGSAWEGSLVGADSLVLSDGGMVAWFYAVHPWPPVPPPEPLAGDVNVDGRVDLQDLIKAASIYESREGDLGYTSFADLAPEWGVINIFDMVTIAYHYGEEYDDVSRERLLWKAFYVVRLDNPTR